ncbi:MAG: hypothetical protein ACRCZP_15465 [Phycicoccus sp.]
MAADVAGCECALRVENLRRIYDERYLAAAESGQPETQALAQQVRDDLAVLAENCATGGPG